MENIKVITTKLPTYLQLLMQEGTTIRLVYQEKGKSETPPAPKALEISLEDSTSQLELTGNPLQTDLGGNDSICSDGLLVDTPPSWTAEEGRQHPLALDKARSFINNELKNSTRKDDLIFCVCDGTDSQRTIGLGAKAFGGRFARLLLHVLPCHNENDEITTIEYMKKEHLKNVRTPAHPQIKIHSVKNYNLFGHNLKNSPSLHNAEYNGNICLQVVSTEIHGVSQNNAQNQMNFQVVAGHKSSPLRKFWEELSRIHSFIKLFEISKSVSESTVINTEVDSMDSVEVTFMIGEFLTTVTTSKRLMSTAFDLDNLRQTSVFDMLWDTIKHCRSLSDLRECFHFFFEEIAAMDKKIVWDEEKTAVCDIVEGIVEGRIAVPTLSFSQSLELLIELGIEKLKKDYLSIVVNFAAAIKDAVLKKWGMLLTEGEALKSAKPSLQRRSRFSISAKATITDLTSTKLKFSFLSSMHKVCEFIFLYTDRLPIVGECFDSYCQSLCADFLLKSQTVVQSNEFKPCLSHFAVPISPSDASVFIKDKSPTAFSVKLWSALHSAEVSTVFHFSQLPIAPPCVFSDYEIVGLDDDDENVKMYVVTLVEYVNIM